MRWTRGKNSLTIILNFIVLWGAQSSQNMSTWMTHGQGLEGTTCLFTSSNLGNSESWRAEYYCWLTTSLEHNKRVERSFNFSSCSCSILFHYAQKNSMMFGSCNCPNTSSTTSFVINWSTHHVFSLDPDTLSLTIYYWYVVILLCLVYCWAIVCAGLLKGRDMCHWMPCTAIAKPTNSSDPAVYAHS